MAGSVMMTETQGNIMLHTRLCIIQKSNGCQMKKCDIFLIFVQNIDCGYSLEPLH